jgi:acyl-CoA thioesterase-2
MDIRYINAPLAPEGEPVLEPQLMWLRIPEKLPDDPRIHAAALAYLADSTLVDHVMLPHGLRWQDGRLTGASLDHAMWFHRPARADRWLLYDQQVEATAGARGMTTGRFIDAQGLVVATCGQEGLMRWGQ